MTNSHADTPEPSPTKRANVAFIREYFNSQHRQARRAHRRARRAARTTFRRWLIRSSLVLALIIIVLVGATTGYSFYRLGQILRITSNNVVATDGPTENILLIGSTSRCAATEIKQYQVQCENGVNGINSDVVLIMHLNPSTGQVSLLSIPRDTFVPGARTGGLYNKIDAALVDGPDQLVVAIEQDFGIPINHFVELNFDTFANVVNAIGGLHVYFPNRLVDASSGLDVHHTGCIYFNGNEALELVRSRHLYWFEKGQKPNMAAIQAATNSGVYYTPDSGGQYDGSGDLGRITRVHLFLNALAKTVIAHGFGNPLTDNSLIGAIAPNLEVDSKFGNSEILSLALDFRHINVASIPEFTAPIVNDASTLTYKGYSYGLVVFPTEPQDQQAVDSFLRTTPPGLKLKTSSISVSVVDGTQSAATTQSVASQLGSLGYRIAATSATNYVGPVSETTVKYAKGHLQQAERVMSSLSGTVVLGQGTPAAGADVSVITGSDLAVNANSSHNGTATTTGLKSTTLLSPTTTTASTTTTVPAAAVTNPNLGAPTSAKSTIASYDPRSCPTK